MDKELRDKAILAIASCDQIEMAIREKDEVMIAVYRKAIKDWAKDITKEKMLVWCQMVRGEALAALRELEEEDCEGA